MDCKYKRTRFRRKLTSMQSHLPIFTAFRKCSIKLPIVVTMTVLWDHIPRRGSQAVFSGWFRLRRAIAKSQAANRAGLAFGSDK